MFEFAVASHGVSCLTPLGVLQDRDWAQRWTEWKDLPSAKFERLWTSLDIFGLFQRRHTWNYMGHPKDILKCKNRDIFMSAHCHVLKCVLHAFLRADHGWHSWPYFKIFNFKRKQTIWPCATRMTQDLLSPKAACRRIMLWSSAVFRAFCRNHTCNAHTHIHLSRTHWRKRIQRRSKKIRNTGTAWETLRPCGCLPFAEACQR